MLFLRIKNKGEFIAGNNVSGPCVLWTKKGCLLTFDERPKGGKLMIPREYGRCEQLYIPEELLSDWIPYQAFLRELTKKYWYADLPVQYLKRGT